MRRHQSHSANMIIKIMKIKQNGGDNDFDDVDDYNYLTNIYILTWTLSLTLPGGTSSSSRV